LIIAGALSTFMRVELFGGAVDLDESLIAAKSAALRAQLAEYERGERREFDVSVAFPDDFVGDVMRAMARIPYGETRTYGDLAEELGSSPVAVGQACGRNPIPVVVPCHRVVGANSIGGFSANGGVELKRKLLALERGESLRAYH
jgi:methylated-DNA-[protein]-cysteine S-methyltransferase